MLWCRGLIGIAIKVLILILVQDVDINASFAAYRTVKLDVRR